MSTVLRTTAPLSAAEARALTDRIRSTAEDLAALLREAYEREAWRALGYASWREYATTELSITQSRAYQLLDHAKVIAAIEDAAGRFPPGVKISERDARHLKPVLDEVTDEIRDRIEQGEDPGEAARAVVEEKREERLAARREEEEEDEGGFDLVAELEHANDEIRRLESLVDSLQTSDAAREIATWATRYAQLEGRLHQELVTSREAQRQAKYQGDVLRKIREALGVAQTQQVLPRIRALLEVQR